MPNRSTTKLLIKHILHHYWQVRDFALNTTFTGGVTALVSAHFFVILFHTINDTPPLPQPQFNYDVDEDRFKDTLRHFVWANILVGR